MDRMTSVVNTTATSKTSPEQLLEARKVVRDVYMDDRVKDYIVDVVFATREPQKKGHERSGSADRIRGQPAREHRPEFSGARACLLASPWATSRPKTWKAIGPDVLRHRVVLSYEAEAEEVTAEDIVRRVFEVVEVP